MTDALRLFETMARIRAFELVVEKLVSTGVLRGLVHTSVGNEASAAGVCSGLGAEDYLLTGHRGHGHLIARGAERYAVMAEILGRRDGLCRGMGGSMHLVDMQHGAIGATGVVGGNLSMALGAAHAANAAGRGGVAVVFFGDGATCSGGFHESLNLASLWRLPVLFVCENNTMAEFTGRDQHSLVEHVVDFAQPFGIEAVRMQATDAVAVDGHVRGVIASMRQERRPYLLELETRRLVGHYAGDPRRGGDAIDPAEWDPLLVTAARLERDGRARDEIEGILARADAETEELTERALNAELASADDLERLVSP